MVKAKAHFGCIENRLVVPKVIMHCLGELNRIFESNDLI